MDKNINFLIFGRFPTERAYGVHVVSNAKSFQKYGKVKVIYPSTNNPKTIHIRPEKYFSNSDGIIFEKINFYDVRKLVRPGLSGWAQVNYPYGASVEDAKYKLGFEIFYIKNFSTTLDLIILFKTLRLVFNLAGSKPKK